MGSGSCPEDEAGRNQAVLPKMKQAAESTKERSRSNFQEFPAPQRVSLVTLKV